MLVASLVTSGRSIDQYSPDAVESIKITEFEKQKLIRLMAGDFLIKKIPMKYKKPFIEREFLIQKKVAHKNVVRVYHTHENMIFMEYVKGFNLLYRPQFWTKNKRIFAYIFKEIAEGIKFMHDKGVVHGDLKPCNILVSEEGDIKICDFGSSVEINRVNAKGATRTEGTDSDKMPYSKEEYDLSFTRQFVAPEFIKPDSVSPEEFMLTLIQKKKTNPKWKALKSGQLKFRLKDDQFPTKESDVFSF
ncbi:putative cell division control protein 15, partial [Mitosporidium daphniae]